MVHTTSTVSTSSWAAGLPLMPPSGRGPESPPCAQSPGMPGLCAQGGDSGPRPDGGISGSPAAQLLVLTVLVVCTMAHALHEFSNLRFYPFILQLAIR